MIIVWIISVIIIAAYCCLIVYFLIGWLRISEQSEVLNNPAFKISVIVPLRNEAENIDILVQSLKNQNTEIHSFEVIFVNDHSTDDTEKKLKELINWIDNFSLINLDSESGKKAAIKAGVFQARGELIVTTDADCYSGPDWLGSMAAYYKKTDAVFISGPVAMDHNGLSGSFQSLDFLSLVSSGAGSFGNRKPVMCNGANLAFKKSVFLEVMNDLDNKYVSGDDIFLMNQLSRKYPGSVMFLKSRKAIITTKAEKKLSSFINQRLRWASKTSGVKNNFYLLTAMIVLLMNILILASLALFIVNPDLYLLFLVTFFSKTITDSVFLCFPAGLFNKHKSVLLILPYQILYSLYITFTGIMSNFLSFRWKNRNSG